VKKWFSDVPKFYQLQASERYGMNYFVRFDIPPVDSENPPFKWSDEVFPVALLKIHRPEQKNTEKTSETPKSQLYPNIKI